MQIPPPKYQASWPSPTATQWRTIRDPLDHEEEQPDPGIPFSGTRYAKDCIPLENKCNVTVVTGGSGAGILLGMGVRRQRSSTASEWCKTWVAARWREKKRQKVYKGGCGEDARKEMASAGEKLLPVDATQVGTQLRDFMKLLLLPVVVVKAEQVHQIADRWTIQRNVGIVRVRHRIVEIVAAAAG
jgi:hypothetical protein